MLSFEKNLSYFSKVFALNCVCVGVWYVCVWVCVCVCIVSILVAKLESDSYH